MSMFFGKVEMPEAELLLADPMTTNKIDTTNTYTTGTSTGDYITITAPMVVNPLSVTYTLNYSTTDPTKNKIATLENEFPMPKCVKCRAEVESQSTYLTQNGKLLTLIFKCHGEKRRIDIALRKFKGNVDDASEWFSETFEWVFDEETEWLSIKPADKVTPIRATKNILKKWLDEI